MNQPHRPAVFMLFVIMAATTLGTDFPHAVWFVVVAGAVMVAVVVAVEKLRDSAP